MNQSAIVILERKPELREKLAAGDVQLVPFVGIASTERVDFEGERIHQDGLNWDYFLAHGRIIDNHGRSGKDVIGHGTKVERIVLPDGTPAVWIEGYLYEHEGTEDLLRAIRTAQRAGRPFGLSIEAANVRRNGNEILSADVINVAVVPYPINTDTMMMVLKSFAAKKGLTFGEVIPDTYEGGAALVPQSLQGGVAMSIQEAVEKFLAERTPEEKAALRDALLKEASNEASTETQPPSEAEETNKREVKVQVPEFPVEEETVPEEEKGLEEIAEGVEPVEIDVTAFLESFTNAVSQGLQRLEGILKELSAKIDTIAGVTSEVLEGYKGLRKHLESTPAVVKGVSLGSPNETTTATTKSPGVIKGLLIAKALDESQPKELRLNAGYLAARMDSGYMPTPEELARFGISL